MRKSWRCFVKYSKYLSYRDSGVAWLGDVPEHWEATRLGNLGVLTASGTEATPFSAAVS